MNPATVHVCLHEWDSWAPQPGGDGWEVFLGDGSAAQEVAGQLTREGRLSVVETRHGLAIGATSYVGRVRLGDVTVTVQPKLRGLPLWRLVRYAFDLHDLRRYDDAGHETEPEAFQDIVVARLVDDVPAQGVTSRQLPTDRPGGQARAIVHPERACSPACISAD